MHKIYFLYKIKLINKNIFFMTNLDKVNYYFITKYHKNYIENKKLA